MTAWIQSLVGIVFAGAFGLLGTLVTVWAKRRSEAEAAIQTRLDNLQTEQRILIDYVHDLRGQMVDAGLHPLDWPDKLTIR